MLEGARAAMKHTLMWELQKGDGPPIECEAWNEGGTVHVRLIGCEQPERTFGQCSDAVRWAIALEETYLADGWTKVI
jgi:hypothetical protein